MPITNVPKHKWIDMGYEHFALYGPKSLSIKKLSRELNSSRGSFYYQFENIERFIEELLDTHWQLILEYCEVGSKECKNYYPDFFLLLESFPISMKFHRQLFSNRDNPVYNLLFNKVSQTSSKIFSLDLFSKQYDLNYNYKETFDLYLIFEESWHSRINPNDFSSASKMQELAQEVITAVLKFVDTDLYLKLKEKSKS